MIQIAILSAAVVVALSALAFEAARSAISAHRARQRRWQERRQRILVDRLLRDQQTEPPPTDTQPFAPGLDLAAFITGNEAARLRALAGTRR